MKLNLKTLILSILFFLSVLMFNCNCLFSQNSLLLQKKSGTHDYFIHSGDKIKIKTIDNRTARGKISEIKDSTLIIHSRDAFIEIPYNNINYIYNNKNQLLRLAIGAPIFVISAILAPIAIILVDPVFISIDFGILGVSSAILFINFGNNVHYNYDIIVIKNKKRSPLSSL